MTNHEMIDGTSTTRSGGASTTNVAFERLRAAWMDLTGGLRRRELWLFLGWRDVEKHYRRSVLGPFWLTLSMGIMIAGLGVLYSQIFGIKIATYLPFLTVGFIVWGLIGNSLTGACTIFINASGPLRQLALPFSVQVFQFTWAQLINLGHNFLIYVLVALIFGLNPGWPILLFLPALTLLTLDVVFVALILGPLCLRFRDIPMIVASMTQVAFFMTPILWSAEQIPQRAHFVTLNPFHHLIEIARQPLLGQVPSALHWGVSLAITLILAVLAIFSFARFRARIPYWA